MTVNVKFTESNETFDPKFGEAIKITDGGYERGYAEGYEEGNLYGYTKGAEDGYTNGAEAIVLGTIEKVKSDEVVVLRDNLFNNCNKLKELSIPNLADIGQRACYNCAELKEIRFLKMTGAIGISAFQYCRSLERVEIGIPTSIGAASFHGCSVLRTFIVRCSSVVPMSSNNAIAQTPIANGTGYVYVPKALVERYKTATNWSTYANQIRAIEDYPEITGG